MTATPLPSFFKPANAHDYLYEPDLNALAAEAESYRHDHGIKSALIDRVVIELIGIDLQKSFCFPWDAVKKQGGELYVGGRSGTGAMDDNARIAAFIYQNMSYISKVTPTLDTHVPLQIFFQSFWLDENGKMIPAYATIVENPAGGSFVASMAPYATNPTWFDVRPNPAMAQFCGGNYQWLTEYCLHYVRELKKAGKYSLYIWPMHCLFGSAGHALAGVINEARMFHSWVRGIQSVPMVKGGSPLTENYSVYRPEVLVAHDGKTPVGQRDTKIVEKLTRGTKILYCGQAASHCVLSSIDDHLTEIQAVDPKLAKQVYVMIDGMSSVVVPGVVDFTPQAEAAFDRWANAGINLFKSTDDIRSLPGIGL